MSKCPNHLTPMHKTACPVCTPKSEQSAPVPSKKRDVPTHFGRLYADGAYGDAGNWVRRAEVDSLLDEIERLKREREIVTAAIMARVPNAPPVVEALQGFIRQWNACGSNSDFGRYFGSVRDVAVASLAKYQVSGDCPDCANTGLVEYDDAHGQPRNAPCLRHETGTEHPRAYQRRVHDWAVHCFGEHDANDPDMRTDRYLEEALELAQAAGCAEETALRILRYVYGRPRGVIAQEVGGVMVSLAVLCKAFSIDLNYCAEAELDRVLQNVDKIRERHAGKPNFRESPLKAKTEPVCRICGDDNHDEGVHDSAQNGRTDP